MIYKFFRARMAAVLTVAASIFPLAASSGCSSEPAPGGDGDGATCDAPHTLCGANTCYNLNTSSSNCGTCGNACAAGSSCVAGTCACSAGYLDCGAGCTSPMEDPSNCGACGTVCGAATPFCSQGTCSATCAAGEMACGNSCVNTMASATNCGGCGISCTNGEMCQAGACVCPAGASCDDGVPVGTGGSPGGTGGLGNTGGAPDGTGGVAGGTGGVINNDGDPPGFWRYDDLHGCAWTGVDATASGTTVTPSDFTAKAVEDAYCASGTVGGNADYESVALLGFNIGEDPATADCSYDPNAAQSMGPPGVVINTAGGGIAANIVKQGADTSFTFRVQIQGPNGATDETQRWCATIDAEQGKIFVPWADFNTQCWDNMGTAYAGEPISAVVFLVPGEPTAVPYDFCVNGFAVGDAAEDAPDGPAEQGDQTGTVGYAGSEDGDFDRVRITQGGEQYIIQNNNWGNPAGSDLILDYINNSFTVSSGNGSTPGNGIPASFPSIFIGANGNIGVNGTLSTSATDGLPAQISGIGSIPTSFAWSGSTGSFNTTYDVWFANSPPTPGSYNDGIDGFVMVWVHDPADAQPIGSSQGMANIAGINWNVWVGPRGEGPEGYNDAPVVSFVAPSDVSTLSFDLKEFIDAAGSHGISSSMYLTDVFFGFEIWNGGGGGGLSVDSFTIDVQ